MCHRQIQSNLLILKGFVAVYETMLKKMLQKLAMDGQFLPYGLQIRLLKHSNGGA
jgi:hypothetical protein